jgi:hypothetical protein
MIFFMVLPLRFGSNPFSYSLSSMFNIHYPHGRVCVCVKRMRLDFFLFLTAEAAGRLWDGAAVEATATNTAMCTSVTTETRRKPTLRERSTKRRGAKKTTGPEEGPMW